MVNQHPGKLGSTTQDSVVSKSVNKMYKTPEIYQLFPLILILIQICIHFIIKQEHTAMQPKWCEITPVLN